MHMPYGNGKPLLHAMNMLNLALVDLCLELCGPESGNTKYPGVPG